MAWARRNEYAQRSLSIVTSHWVIYWRAIVLHAFEGKAPPFSPESLAVIEDLKRVYGLDLDSSASHKLIEQNDHQEEDQDA